ncbi:MAG TPA: glycosyltransferase family 39 protein, partial [Leptolyngbya sp.]|nr:glycosyltransferase family 39 protein [Leptolyngbya sp.]
MKLIQKWWTDQPNQQVAAILVAGLLFRSFIAFWLPPGFDEAYYYLYTQHPSLSYFDHPPFVALVTAIGLWLTGDVSQFSIRIGSLLLFPFTLYFLYRATVHLFSVRVGLITLSIASAIPIFLLGFGTFTLPDSPLMLFWALTLWVGAIEFFPQEHKYIPTYRVALIGLFVGLACVGKYHGFLLGFGLLGFCATSRRHWAVFRSPWTILSFLLFLIVFSPVLYWNSQHHWISFLFQADRSVPNQTYNLFGTFGAALMASLYLFPTFGLPLWAVSIREIILAVRSRFSNSIHSFILWNSAPVFLIFTFIGGYQQILPGWTMPGFFAITPLLGLYASRWRSQTLKRWLIGSTIAV